MMEKAYLKLAAGLICFFLCGIRTWRIESVISMRVAFLTDQNESSENIPTNS